MLPRSRYLMQRCDIELDKLGLVGGFYKPRVIACLNSGLCLVSCHMPKLRDDDTVDLQRSMLDGISNTVYTYWHECHALIICADYNQVLPKTPAIHEQNLENGNGNWVSAQVVVD